MYKPGGDKIGKRRLGTHIDALKGLGAELNIDGYYEFRAKKLIGSELFLDEASVMGTENAIMGAALSEGTTTILNAASEPHVQGLCRMLNSMGAKISGIGSNILTIEGVKRLHGGVTHKINPDHIEIGSIIVLSAIIGNGIRIKNVIPSNFKMINLMLRKLGIEIKTENDDFFIEGGQDLVIESEIDGGITKIEDAPWPGFPTDLMSITIVGATQSVGSVLIFEKMFEGRMFFVDNLIQMGANIVLCDLHRAVVTGKTPLRGYKVASPDIRAGMSLLVAALTAKGKTEIGNIEQIDRGYQKIDERLNLLGAKITRIDE
jgi:UDP-N-acetylglucosamine 1-carboxyvinyltransferase